MVERPCVFCSMFNGVEPYTSIRDWGPVCAIVPKPEVTPGHALVIPRRHVRDAAEDPMTASATMLAAAELAAELAPCNIITSIGAAATQSVFHLHLHVVPRRRGDGLHLPWSRVRGGRNG